MLTKEDKERLRLHPGSANGAVWIPKLLDEIERLERGRGEGSESIQMAGPGLKVKVEQKEKSDA